MKITTQMLTEELRKLLPMRHYAFGIELSCRQLIIELRKRKDPEKQRAISARKYLRHCEKVKAVDFGIYYGPSRS